jgi:glycine/D-amino acid oxidase-like deaminating enzyme
VTVPRGVSPWLDGGAPVGPPLAGDVRADVVVIGAGFTGLWTALQLVERDPALEVVVLEATVVGYGASGRNGGFVDPSLTHGIHNGLAHFPDEIDELVRLGAENLAELIAFVHDHDIACHLEPVGTIEVATEPWQLADLEAGTVAHARAGERVELLDAERLRKEVDSPTYLGGLHRPDGGALVDPAALARGLARVARERGVTIHEGSPVEALEPRGAGVRARTPGGRVDADRAVLATNAYSHHVLPRLGRWFVPVYDHVLLTEPLTPEQLGRIGWRGRQGLADTANQFHYYRLTPDDRILWGGYDAIYRYGSRVGPRYDHRRATYDLLARNFRRTFPQLDDVRFDRWWGGAIATTTRFTVTFGDALGGGSSGPSATPASASRRPGSRARAHRPAARAVVAPARAAVHDDQAVPVPARAAAVGRGPGDPQGDPAGRRPGGTARPVAHGPRPRRDRLRLVTRPRRPRPASPDDPTGGRSGTRHPGRSRPHPTAAEEETS